MRGRYCSACENRCYEIYTVMATYRRAEEGWLGDNKHLVPCLYIHTIQITRKLDPAPSENEGTAKVNE